MEIIKIIAVAVAFAVAVWVLYTLVKMSDKAKEERSNEAPYKVEPPKSTEQLALPHKPIKWTFTNAPEPKREDRDLLKLLENWGSLDELKTKRKYTKRSKYWSSPKVKTKMSKARKARKSSKSK